MCFNQEREHATILFYFWGKPAKLHLKGLVIIIHQHLQFSFLNVPLSEGHDIFRQIWKAQVILTCFS